MKNPAKLREQMKTLADRLAESGKRETERQSLKDAGLWEEPKGGEPSPLVGNSIFVPSAAAPHPNGRKTTRHQHRRVRVK